MTEREVLTTLRTGLDSLADSLDRACFRLPFPSQARRERDRAELVRSIREYLLPRLRDPDAPIVVGIFGPTGSGKSVLLNTLAQKRLSAPGAVRPTTETPVIWAHRAHAGRYWQDFVRRVEERAGPQPDMTVGDDELTRTLTFIDTPPFDFVAPNGRVVAQDLLSLTDLVVFVASGLRYADGDAWDFIRHAQRRGLPILFVMNRLPPGEERHPLLSDYADRLAQAGLLMEPDPSLLFAVDEQDVSGGMLTQGAVTALRTELSDLADPSVRHDLLGQSTEGAVFELADRTEQLAGFVDEELDKARELRAAVDGAYDEQRSHVLDDVVSGRFRRFADLDPAAVVSDLAGVVTRHAGHAAQHAAAVWDLDSIGNRLLEQGGQGLWRHGSDTPHLAEAEIGSWIAGLEDLAVVATRRGRLNRWARRKVAAEMRALVLDPDRAAGKRLEKRYREDGVTALTSRARGALAVALDRVFAIDAARFYGVVGDVDILQGLSEALSSRATEVAMAAEALES